MRQEASSNSTSDMAVRNRVFSLRNKANLLFLPLRGSIFSSHRAKKFLSFNLTNNAKSPNNLEILDLNREHHPLQSNP